MRKKYITVYHPKVNKIVGLSDTPNNEYNWSLYVSKPSESISGNAGCNGNLSLCCTVGFLAGCECFDKGACFCCANT
jgi:hypothetical protein